MMLRRKLLRDLWEYKDGYLACVIVMTIGLMIYSSYALVSDNLFRAQKMFYEEQHFADVFVRVKEMPKNKISQIDRIDGVAEVEGRLIKDVRVLEQGTIEAQGENVYLRFVSVDMSKDVNINQPEVVLGQYLQAGSNMILLDNKFYEANNLQEAAELSVLIGGQEIDFTVGGAARSPEFIYAFRNMGEIYPDPQKFGIAYMPYDMMQNVFDSQESINDIAILLDPGVQFEDVENEIEAIVDDYGLEVLYEREDQMSHVVLREELNQLDTMAKILPLIFLSVAAMVLYIMLRRMVESQRGQIGILKAFGYTDREIFAHYLSFSWIIGIIGGLAGGITGNLLSFPYLDLYETYFNMPGIDGYFSFKYLGISILLALLFSVWSGYSGVRKILYLKPAQALSPEIAAAGKKIFLERYSWFWQMLTTQGKMGIRNISRNMRRSAFIFVGIMFTFALVGFATSMTDMMQKMIFDQFDYVETYDVKVTFDGLSPGREVLTEIKKNEGIYAVEPMAEVAFTLKHSWREEGVLVIGLEENSEMYHLRDKDGQVMELPGEGMVISEQLSKNLDVDVGESLLLESAYMKEDEEVEVVVTGILPQFIGSNAYMQRDEMMRALGKTDLISSVMLTMDESHYRDLKTKYQETDRVVGIANNRERREDIEQQMGAVIIMITIMSVLGILTGFSIIYNAFAITLSQRSRELASLLVLGMSRKEVMQVITFEQWFISFFAILAGIPATKGILYILSWQLSSDMFTLPVETSFSAMIFSGFVSVFSILVAQYFASRKIKKLDLVEVLKSKE